MFRAKRVHFFLASHWTAFKTPRNTKYISDISRIFNYSDKYYCITILLNSTLSSLDAFSHSSSANEMVYNQSTGLEPRSRPQEKMHYPWNICTSSCSSKIFLINWGCIRRLLVPISTHSWLPSVAHFSCSSEELFFAIFHALYMLYIL
jgi:hypothetical protein